MSSRTKYRLSHPRTNWRPKAKRKKLFQSRFPQKRTLEDSIEFLARKGLLANAAAEAIKERHSKGLAVTIQEGNTIYRFYPDGRKEALISNLPPPRRIHQRILQIPD